MKPSESVGGAGRCGTVLGMLGGPIGGRCRWGGAGLAALALAVLSHCGSRSQLPQIETGEDNAGTGGGGTSPDGGVTPPPPPCVLQNAGPAMEIMAAGNSNVMAPSMVRTDGGDASTPARVALQGFVNGGTNEAHPNIQLQRFTVTPPWSTGVKVDQPPVIFGAEAHGWGEMAHAPGGVQELAMAWYSESGMDSYTAFRALDIDSWTAKPPVEVAPNGRPALSLAPGSGVGTGGVGYEGYGYAIAWRELLDEPEYDTTTSLGVLDLEGKLMLGPLSQGVPAPSPGYSPVITWSSKTYLIATAFPDCGPELPCPPALTVERLRPASSAGEPASLENTWTRTNGMIPHRPALATYGDRTWITWTEAEGNTSHHELYLQELDALGAPVGEAVEVDGFVWPQTRPKITASTLGLTIAYGNGGSGTEPNEPGYDQVVVHQLDHDGTPMTSQPVRIDTTLINDYGPPQAVALDHPRGLLLTWAARSFHNDYYRVAYLGFLECGEP